ncbi:MAG: hypothetical protein J5I98_14900 [Phaeodactylibacter sp.]|nr:hypothetical protein [Phaeodactylibacter sp.]
MSAAFQQYSETAPLKKVIIGRHEGYRAVEAYTERVNESQKQGLPTEADLRPEFESFRRALEEEGVEVLIPEYVGKFVYDQLTPRDLGTVIGNRFVLCNMAKSSRRYEAAGIFRNLLEMEGPEPNILLPPGNEALLEGGDIIVDKGCIFVGLSQRTNQAGCEFLRGQFGADFEVIPVFCRRLEEGEDVLHLDCAFNPVGEGHALIYPQGFREIPPAIIDKYEWIEVTAAEQAGLATNVLSLDSHTLISRNHPECRRVNQALRAVGLRVIELPFDAAPSTGGSVRCCSLPLVRG